MHNSLAVYDWRIRTKLAYCDPTLETPPVVELDLFVACVAFLLIFATSNDSNSQKLNSFSPELTKYTSRTVATRSCIGIYGALESSLGINAKCYASSNLGCSLLCFKASDEQILATLCHSSLPTESTWRMSRGATRGSRGGAWCKSNGSCNITASGMRYIRLGCKYERWANFWVLMYCVTRVCVLKRILTRCTHTHMLAIDDIKNVVHNTGDE